MRRIITVGPTVESEVTMPIRRIARMRRREPFGAAAQDALNRANQIVADVRAARIAEGADIAPRCPCAGLDWSAETSICSQCGARLELVRARGAKRRAEAERAASDQRLEREFRAYDRLEEINRRWTERQDSRESEPVGSSGWGWGRL